METRNRMVLMFTIGLIVLPVLNLKAYSKTETYTSTSSKTPSVYDPDCIGEGVQIGVNGSSGSLRFSITCNSDVFQLEVPEKIKCLYSWTETSWTVTRYYSSYGDFQYETSSPRTEVRRSENKNEYVKIITKLSGDNLTNVVLPSVCNTVYQQAFKDQKKLKQVIFKSPSFVKINDEVFNGCISLTGQVIPTTVTEIGKLAFNGCESLTEINLPEALQSIGEEAFANCTSLTTIKLPAGIKTYDKFFKGCTNLIAIEVDNSNENFISFDGALYDANSRQLIVCPEGKSEITVLPTATKIDIEAFSGCRKMSMIRMPYALAGGVDVSGIVAECAEDCVIMYYGSAEILKSPNPPMAKDSNISITPITRDFAVGGGGAAIITSGSGTWTAAVSDPWLTLNATSGSAGYPVAYTVSANTNVETRVGYVYVSGYTHTVTQEGIGAEVDKTNITVEHQGGNGTVNVTAQSRIVWLARPNVDWISVSPTSGAGEGSVSYQVAPFNEVSTRQGTMTIAGNTVTVFQYGRRMKLESYSEKRDWYAHVIPVTVNALAITEWDVTPNASWISIVDAGNGKGGDLVSIAISENPSYKARTGTVTIGTETFTITQEGRTDLEFSVSPAQSTASVEGAYGLIAVTATPDLPWTAKSGANWVTVVSTTAFGAGNGNIVYSASPNSTLYDRTGTVTVTPEAASGMIAKTHTVTQPAAVSALSLSGYEFEAAGESCAVEVSVADIVEWKVEESLDWLTVNGSISRTGPGIVTLQAVANETVYPRSGTVTIARKTFTVTQKARGVEVEYDTKLFGTDGGMESISIHPDGNVAWTAVASDPTWITIFQGDSGTGDGEIMYIVSPYVGDGTPRTGTITVGDKVIYITQRAYDLSISPNGKKVTGNNGAGEFGVSASIGDVWNAIVTEPWITIVDGYDAGTGSGTVRFIYTENNTGKTRTGKIIVAGEVYTLEQAARTMVSITATAGRGGKVSGGGSYDLGSSVTLTAVPDDGYKFSYWTGDLDSMQNPITVTADVAKSLTAVFEPLPIAFDSVTSGTDGVRLSWNNLAWATEYRIYRGVTSVPSSATVLAEIVNTGNCAYLDESGVVGTTYWYWIEAEGAEDSVMSDPMTGMKQKPIVISPITYGNLRGATHTNPETYQEGTLVSFTNPSGVTGYTFAGWAPSQITADMTGAQTVTANWTANSYSISYNPNGGTGTMDATSATYDAEAIVSANGFTYAGHMFKGWATEVDGEVVYVAGQPVTNLTAQSSGVVTLYAVWGELVVPAPVVTPPDGTVFTEGSCEVTITCPMEGATIYYSTSGSAPRPTNAFEYSGVFSISDTTKIIAFARKDNVNSATVILTITKRSLSLAEAAGDANLVFTTGGDSNWTPMGDNTAATGFSAQSGAISDEECTWMKTTVSGVGTLTFQWKVDCESDYITGEATWDHLRVETEDGEIARIDGTTGWIEQTIVFDRPGAHTICWTFDKDDYNGEEYPDRVWVSGVTWTPASATDITVDIGGGKSVVVPVEWIDSYADIVAAVGGDKAAALQRTAANGRKVWECFMLGVDPTKADDDFRITRFWMENGMPKFEFSHSADGLGNSFLPRIKTLGKEKLTDSWLDVPPGGNPSFRFFTVTVEMP